MSLVAHIPLIKNETEDTIGNSFFSTYGSTTELHNGGPFGSYCFFNSKILYFKPKNLKGSKKLSVAFWAKFETMNQADTLWSDVWGVDVISNNGSIQPFRMETTSTGNWYNFFNNGILTDSGGMCSYEFGTGVWQHIIVTIDISGNKYNATIYINGQKIWINTITIQDNQCATFGEKFWIGDNHMIVFNMVDFRIYNHILSTYEIKDLQKRESLHYTFNQFLPKNVEQLTKGENTLNRTWDAQNKAWRYTLPSGVQYGYNMLFPRINYLKANTDYIIECECYNGSSDSSIVFITEQQLSGFQDYSSDFILNSDTHRLTCSIKNQWVKFYAKIRTTSDTSDQRLLFYPCPYDNTFKTGYQLLRNIRLYEGSEYIENGICSGKIYDVSGHGLNGEVVNITSSLNNKIGYNAVNFNGSNNYIQVNNNDNYLNGPFTVSAWIYSREWNNYKGVLGPYFGQTDGGLVFCQYENSYVRIGGSNKTSWLNSFNIEPWINSWKHIVLTRDENNIAKLYIDGKLIQIIENFNVVPSNNKIWIGKSYDASNRFFNGNLDDLRIYCSALSEKDVLKLYNKKASLFNNKLIISNIKEISDKTIKNNITSKGILEIPTIVENKYFYTKDGAKFLKIFSHDIRYNNSLFSPNNVGFEVEEINKFSRLCDIPLLRSNDNKFEFLLRYPEEDWKEEYDVLEYIQSTGDQYIDTGFIPNQNTRIQFSGQINKGNDYNFFFGCGSSRFSNSIECYYVNGSDYIECYYGTQWVQICKATSGTITLDFNKNTHNVSINGVNYNKTYNAETFNSPNSLCFFDLNRANTEHNTYTQPGHKMYYCKIYSNDLLVRDYVPVRRSATGEVGLFDKITKTFLKSATSDLVAGPIVSHNYNHNRWKQTANPLTTKADANQTAESMGYQAVEISWNGRWYYGIGLSTSSNSYLDCEAGHANWFGAIGQNTLWNNGFPAPDGSSQKWVELYIRIDNTDFNKQSSIRNNKAIFMDEFIEE